MPGQHFHHTLIWDASILRLRKSRCDGNVALALVWRTFLLHPDFRVSQTDHPNARRHQNDAKAIVIVVTFQNVRFRVSVSGLPSAHRWPPNHCICNVWRVSSCAGAYHLTSSESYVLESDYNYNGFCIILRTPCADGSPKRGLGISRFRK